MLLPSVLSLTTPAATESRPDRRRRRGELSNFFPKPLRLFPVLNREEIERIQPCSKLSMRTSSFPIPGTDDWTGEEFNEKIVRVEGKPPLLTVDECKLQGGIGVLENVKFRHHPITVEPSEFRLGARIAKTFDGIVVKEANTKSFAIKTYRGKYDDLVERNCQ